MLIQLEIKNFAIIEHSIINFEQGFNVLSGETGAGKSILFDAISSILGERTSKNMIRKGKEKAELKAVFLKTEKMEALLASQGIEISDDYLIVERHINKSGRSVVKLNDSIQTTQTIKEICHELVEICGQREHQELLKEDRYVSYLDALGDDVHQETLRQYRTLYGEWKELTKQLDHLLSNEREKEQLLDLYRFQKQEIEEAKLSPGEDEKLEEEKKFLASFEKISHSVQKALKSLATVDALYDAKQELHHAAKYDENLSEMAERLEKAYYELDDIRGDVTAYIDHVEYDEARLNFIMMRLEEINKIKRKYADTIEGVFVYYDEIAEKISDVDNKEEKIETLKKNIKGIEQQMKASANTLHAGRARYARLEEEKILVELKELCMPDALLSFVLQESDHFTSEGTSQVSLWFNANKGEDLQPLAKVASGGEMSRVLLAMKIAGRQNESVPTILFDEVDEGVGGEVGRVIGNKLERLGNEVQVICISHLPQVAARGDIHFLIQKKTSEERTVSHVRKLSEAERKEEIARMIYGDEKNETTLKQAEEMLKKK